MNLVREYVVCMDEMSQIYSIYEQKLEFLEKFRKDCEMFLEKEPNAATTGLTTSLHEGFGNTGKAMAEQIDWAIDLLRSNHEGLPRTLNDLRNSLDDVSSQVPRPSLRVC